MRLEQHGLAPIMPWVFVFLWSSGVIFVDIGLRDAGPLSFLAVRLLASAVFLWIVCFWIRPPFPKDRATWQSLVVTGLLLQAGYQIFFFYALAHGVSPGLLAIILGIQPLMTAVLTRGHLTAVQWLGLLLGMLGLGLVVANSLFIEQIGVIGVTSAVLAMISITIGTLLQKKSTTNLFASMAIQYTGSAIVLTVLAWGLEHWAIHWTAMFVIALTWMVLIISVGATLVLYAMLRTGAVVNVVSVFYGVPPVTALLAYIVLGTPLHTITLLGMAFVVSALVLVNRKTRTISK